MNPAIRSVTACGKRDPPNYDESTTYVTGRSARSVVIVGAGVIGLAIGLRLQLAGKNVTLIDRDAPGRGCSFGNVGRIANESIEPLASLETLRDVPRYLLAKDGPLGIRLRHAHRIAPWLLRFARASLPANFASGKAALQSLQHHSLPAFTRLMEDAGALSLLKTNGHLLVTEDRDAIPALSRLQQRLAVDGILARPVSRNDVQQLAPGLSPQVAGGLFFPDTAHVVEPYHVCRRLAAAIENRGGRICRGHVTDVTPAPAGGFRLRYGEQECAADAVVIAAGAWSRPLASQLGHRLPLDTERGYHLTAGGWQSDLRMPVESLERRTVMTPMRAGLRITGFVEFGGLALPPNPARFDALSRHLQALVPGVEHVACTKWMGHRPSLPDHLPVIGTCTKYDRAILAFGHQHLGLTLSGITAEIVAALLDGRTPAVDLTPFRCNRYD